MRGYKQCQQPKENWESLNPVLTRNPSPKTIPLEVFYTQIQIVTVQLELYT